jgi:hypothetical protein
VVAGAIGWLGFGSSGSGNSAGAPLLEALPTEDRPSLRGLEWHGGFLATTRTIGASFHLWVIAGRRGPHSGRPLGLAGFAAFGFVLELFVVEEQLFSRGEDEVGAAVNTLQNLVLEFHGELLLQSAIPAAMDKGQVASGQRTGLRYSCGQLQVPKLGHIPGVRPTMHRMGYYL